MKPQLEFSCPEKWNSMSAKDDGRYCGKCEKVVTDFTELTNEEIAAKINSATTGNSCGNFKAFQLEQPFDDKRNALIRFYQKISVASNKRNFTRTIQLGLAMILLLISGCHRRMSGMYASSHDMKKRHKHYAKEHRKEERKKENK